MGTKLNIQKTVARTVSKHVDITPVDIAGLLKKAVGAPEATPLLETKDGAGNTIGYSLSWDETPKSRAPRKAKVAVAA